ncbi:YncE family protein [Zhouia sp. PK063]|uniref:YncE family protein n=1 Tax=Zhouia sp. PK063 TaxID=3373602 RepID=UPI0037B0627A
MSKQAQKAIIYDYQTLDSITAIPVGTDPHEIVTNQDGSLAYISKPSMKQAGHEIAVIDLHQLKFDHMIDLNPFKIPHGLVYRDHKLWFTAQGSKVVGVYDIETKQVESVFGTGEDFTHLLYVTKDGMRFYTTNVESGTLSIYEKKVIPPYMPPTGVLPAGAQPRTEWRQTLLTVGFGAEGFDVTADEDELWTARPDGHILIVDLKQKTIKADINSNVEGLHRLKITPDGKTVCIVSVKTGDLLYYDIKTHQLQQKTHIGRGAGIYMDKKKNRMFISCTPDNYIVVIDLNTRKEIKRIPIGRPDGVTSVIQQE